MNSNIKDILEWILCIVVAIVLALSVRYYVGTPTVVESSSMYPTLIEGQRLILNRLARTNKDVLKRGEIVTFEAPSRKDVSKPEADLENPTAKYEEEPKGFLGKFVYYVIEWNKLSYIKRVVGLPGEHIEIKNNAVYINGELLEEPYLQNDVITEQTGGYIDLIVPEGTVFVMGDNRRKKYG